MNLNPYWKRHHRQICKDALSTTATMAGLVRGAIITVLCIHLAAASRYSFLPHGYDSPGYPEECQDGFRPDDKGGCTDDDECRYPVIQCGINSDCFNTAGSFVCVCRPGYEKNDLGNCVDLNECGHDYKGNRRNFCTVNENCVNEIGKYSCYCKPGFVRDPKVGCRKIGSRLPKQRQYEPVNPYISNPFSANTEPKKPYSDQNSPKIIYSPQNTYSTKSKPAQQPHLQQPEPPKNSYSTQKPYPPKPELKRTYSSH